MNDQVLRVFNGFYKQIYSQPKLFSNKTLYGALTRWGYTNMHITVYDTRYSTQLFQLRSQPSPELRGIVEHASEGT